MNHILTDSIKLGYGISGALRDKLLTGSMQSTLQLCRPNWSVSEHRRALAYLRGCQLRNATQFGSLVEYMAYLNKELQRFTRQYPVRAEMQMADEMQLARWEARWARLRSRGSSLSNAPGDILPLRQAA